ncbi:MAG: hypothetical protein RIB65_17700 [Ilumatobacter fluminis]|uniref:Uncharacterized protein n=1 Tax=Ilumatobacter fluminis TaxID=467091 RepID=A0A4R7I2X2_9ACTN|nr:hypothetical protein [Ilumatobacter fluminis]TDT16996.1 hypothetical protein BDK89_2597 [Ilumatobacter fluminis]
MTPREVLQAIKQPTGDIGAVFYFHPATLERGKELGLDGFRFYFLGRGGVLGDVEAGVVQSAFGYFNPDLLAKMWNTGKEKVPPRDAARAYIECCHEVGRKAFEGIDGLDAYVEAATAVIDAVDGGALTLFAGVRAEPVPSDTAGAAIHQAMVLRELRGSAHLAAIAAVGVSTRVAHAIKRPDDLAMFGYEEPPAVTDADRAALERAEQITDDILEPAFAVLSDEQGEALVAATTAMHAALTG